MNYGPIRSSARRNSPAHSKSSACRALFAAQRVARSFVAAKSNGFEECFQALVLRARTFVFRESFPKPALIRSGGIGVVVVHSVAYWGTYLNINRLRTYTTLDWTPVLLSRATWMGGAASRR